MFFSEHAAQYPIHPQSGRSKLGGAVFRIYEPSSEVEKWALQLDVSKTWPSTQVSTDLVQQEHSDTLLLRRMGKMNRNTQRRSAAGVHPKLIVNFEVTDYWKLHFAVSWFRRLWSLFHCSWSFGKGSEVCQATEGRKEHQSPSLIQDWVSFLFSVCCLRTPVWPVAPVPGDVPIKEFPLLWQHGCDRQPCVSVTLMPAMCEKNSLLLHGVLVSWTHLSAVWSYLRSWK